MVLLVLSFVRLLGRRLFVHSVIFCSYELFSNHDDFKSIIEFVAGAFSTRKDTAANEQAEKI